MPEGDAVRRLADTFDHVFCGYACEVTSPQGRFAASAARINGMVLVGARAVGKHMFLGFAPPELAVPTVSEYARAVRPTQPIDGVVHWVHIHLGLYGWWRFNGDSSIDDAGHGVVRRNVSRVGPKDRHRPMKWGGGAMNDDDVPIDEAEAGHPWQVPEPVGQVRLRLVAPHAVADLAGPTRCELVSDEQRCVVEAKLGPDPLWPGARDDAEAMACFVVAVRKTKRVIGELLMDQSILAGVGNIYRADALFLAGISPMRQGQRVSRTRLEDLWRIVCDLMNRGFEAGYLITMDPLEAPDPPIEGDEEASRWYVYHRTGRPCLRCNTPIAEKVLQGRRLFWCPSCQR
ncbi:Fpg/Nei family DNA glycosylase [Schaalia suimastitidis]|uniref:Fpg/Nei family DNA glycosylase n=1 Tax=Schaalia suimastitidis TaxID=121163 RepID=UPI000416C065|nr:formamidopyrimidine-DNA glycosylase [Schaalia suimastitidis]